MREFRTYGSVRGALSDERPYRERPKSVETQQPPVEKTGRGGDEARPSFSPCGRRWPSLSVSEGAVG
jgi:hypothetical protein